MAQVGQQPFGIRFGSPTTTTIEVVGCSLVSGSILVTANESSTTITTAQLGTDSGTAKTEAGYVGNNTITGLTAYTKYTYTATRGSNTISGYFWTAPEVDDDFIVIPLTCDNSGSLGGQSDAGYTQIRAIAEANPNKGVYLAHIDDHMGYMDTTQINDNATGGTGHASTGKPSTTTKVYDYALVAFASFGLMVTDTTGLILFWSHDADRLWCMYNLPVIGQWGDHDAGANDMGWQVDPDVGGLTQFTNAKSVYDAFISPFHGTSIDGSNSTAWSHTLGCIKFIAPDGITQGSGDGTIITHPTTIYGSTQIDSILAEAAVLTVPFTMFLMNHGIRYLTNPAVGGLSGASQAIAGNETEGTAAHADYIRLMTAAGGLMTLNSCNGKFGTMVFLHGDSHQMNVLRHRNTAGVNDEWFYGIKLGTVNGATNFGSQNIVEGATLDGTTVEMLYPTVTSAHDWWVMPMYVYGSRPLKEVECDILNSSGVSLWNKKFVEGRGGNDAHAISDDLVFIGSGGDMSGSGL